MCSIKHKASSKSLPQTLHNFPSLFGMDLFYVLAFLFTCTFMYAFNSLFGSKNKLPPGPFPLPIIGNLLELKDKQTHHTLAKLAKTHGPIMRLKLGQVTTIVISSADLAKDIFQTHGHLFSDRPLPEAVRVHDHAQFTVGFLPVQTPVWRDLRRICNNHLFANKVLNGSQYLRRKKTQELLDDVHQSSLNGEAVDIAKAAFKTALNFLSNTFFSIDFVNSANDVGEYKDIVVNLLKASGVPNIADFFPFLKLFDPQGIRRICAVHMGRLFQVFDKLIDERLELRQDADYVPKNDMLDALLDISQENSQVMDTGKIKHLLSDLIAAGTDTTSYAVAWAMAELIRNPDLMLKAKKELEEVVGIGNPVEESDFVKLPYLQAIIKETFRLHGTAPLLSPRKAMADVEINGYIIPKGAQILVNQWAIGRDPESWDNPNLFSPERFLGSKIDVLGKDFQLTPFGGGRRICPAMPLAIRMVNLMLASLINDFDWKLENGMRPEEMDMEDVIEGNLILKKKEPLRIIPTKINN